MNGDETVGVSIGSWRWPVELSTDDERHFLICCAREWCGATLLELDEREMTMGWRIEAGQLMALFLEHLQDCRPVRG